MNKIIFTILFIFLTTQVYAQYYEFPKPHKPTPQEERNFEKMLEERLKLTPEQKDYLKANKPKHKKEMEKIVSQMEVLHTKIRNVYLLGLPKYQSELRTAQYKTELAILAQNAKKQRAESRKEFENILTKDQKIELEKMKGEMSINSPRTGH